MISVKQVTRQWGMLIDKAEFFRIGNADHSIWSFLG